MALWQRIEHTFEVYNTNVLCCPDVSLRSSTLASAHVLPVEVRSSTACTS